MEHDELGFTTRAIHVGQAPDPTTGAIAVPIYQTSTFAQAAIGRHSGYEYARTGNPTRRAYEEALASLEAGAWARAFASGMAGTHAILAMLSTGDHVVAADDLYGGTYRLFDKVLSRVGLNFTYVDMTEPGKVAAAMRPTTRLVWIETPTNPLLKVVDIAAMAAVARAGGARTVVDNTFASPYLQRPLELGADLVLHSATKYLGGHSDVVGGIVVGRDPALNEALGFLQNAIGAVPGPLDAWLVLRGLKTLALRMERHSANGMVIARFLAGRTDVERVIYPGLPHHPQHWVAVKQMPAGFGGMVSFMPAGGVAAARSLVTRTRLFRLAESLGGVESLIEVPAQMTHASVADSPLAVPPGLVRLSVGIEDASDLVSDLAQAMDAAD